MPRARPRRAIERALAVNTTPLRLQLGRDAVDAVRGYAETLLADFAAWDTVAYTHSLSD